MKEKWLVVIDMQNDFIDGALGSKEAQAIVPYVADKIRNFKGKLIFTQDTHFMEDNSMSPSYENTLEGKLLPVLHCLVDGNGKSTWGHEINEQILEAAKQNGEWAQTVGKLTFGSFALAEEIKRRSQGYGIESIEVCGLCTDICVVSNALILRATFPNVPMIVDARACAGVTPAKHGAALEVMRSCQIEIIREEKYE